MNARQQVQDCLDFIDASPSPWHVIASLEQRLRDFGFQRLHETEHWSLSAGGRYYVVRDDSSIVMFVAGHKDLAQTGFKILGAHTDSPGLRLKPNPVLNSEQLLRLGVEVYGGPILATFSDRDLSLAGRIAYRTDDGTIASRLLRFEQPLLRLPNLAIHMNRSVNEDGLKLNKQTELPLLFANATQQQLASDRFIELLTQVAGLAVEQILSWEFNIYDTQKGVFWGDNQAFYADSQLDNLASCHAGLTALLNESALNSGNTLVCAFFDHEEIGSESCKGAAGSFLPDVLERVALALDLDKQGYHRALANSLMISADMAHAYQPNFPNAYEPGHKIIVNRGPVIKINANHRYASTCLSEAAFMQICRQAEVPFQKYAHRGDLPCGSTIGPIASAKLGMATVDVGNPMWAMHSARESAGVQDHTYMIKVLNYFFSSI
ncbi:M18 family aminopeptidase [Methylomonas sp. LL1]|uniref:M18 family aminopeptidase n=1 Tax=Methylomonas sp. LL1 TaxID=2785785 RepID=UPI0018C41DAD|nr:M18 family aminopeptidase [Methylomonas sp. LL1]QPK63154.1 M18 family aminopeptidase [Methylomonas sp. LL1]